MNGPNQSNENSEETILAADTQGPTHFTPCVPCSGSGQGFHSLFQKEFYYGPFSMDIFKHMHY